MSKRKYNTKDYQDRWKDKKARLENRELECWRLQWVPLEEREELVANGYLDADDINDPDAVTAAREHVWARVRKIMRERISR